MAGAAAMACVSVSVSVSLDYQREQHALIERDTPPIVTFITAFWPNYHTHIHIHLYIFMYNN